MLRFTALWIPRVLAATTVLFLATARADDDPPGSHPAAAPSARRSSGDINIFLTTPADIEALWKSLGQPDFILMKGGDARKTPNGQSNTPLVVPPAAVVDSVNVRGQAEKDLASLTVTLGVTLASEGPVWVPVRLDGAVLTAVREGDRILEPRNITGQGWQVELRGEGPHEMQIELRTRLKSTTDGYRLELAIPEAGKTQFQLDVPQRVVEAAAGADEPIEPVALPKGQRTRLAAHLTARERLDVSWRVEAETGIQLPHLLAMQGEIAVDVDSGSLRIRSSWIVQAVRGTTRTLELRLDPDVEVLEVEFDGQSPPAGVEKVEGGTRLTINLVDPLRPGAPKKLTMTTRLPLPPLPARVTLHGFSLANAKDQTGAVGIAQSGNLYIQGTAGRGVRQIDPRELRDELRVRPATVLAYQFVDQPFELTLGVEPSPPLVRTESRTTVALSSRGAKVETWLDYKTARGRLFEARVGLPRGLEPETVGPEDIVESSKLEADTTGAVGGRLLTVMLKSKARDQGAFTLRLSGRQAIDPAKPVDVALFRPLDSTSGGGRVAVTTDRDLTVDWAAAPGAREAFRPAMGEPPSDWPWPAQRAPSEADEPPALWLRHDDHPGTLPLHVTVHPRSITHESNLLVRVERRAIEVRQEIVGTVHFGTLDQVELTVPSSIQGRWEIEEGNVAGRKDLGTNEAGDAVTRLSFAQPVSGRLRLRLRYRLPLPTGLEPDKRSDIVVPWVRVREGTSHAPRVRVAADPGIDVHAVGPGWTRDEEQDASGASEFGVPVRFALVGTGREAAGGLLRLAATARPLAALPPLVIARHWLRTVQGLDLALHVNAWYWVETHQGSLPLALPAGAVLERVRVGGEARDQVEPLAQDAGYRIRFPARWATSPVLVGLEYRLDARFLGSTWVPPRLLDGALVEETLWEARFPASRALLGVPTGWTDENTWRWDRYVWKRWPWKSASALTAWVCGPSGRSQATEPVDDARGDYHDYLFGRLGPAADLRPIVVPRFWLLTLCSGGVLGLGSFFLLAWRPPARVLAPAVLAAALCVAIALPASITIVLLQSSLIGVVLLLVMALLQLLVERRRSAAHLFSEPSGLTPTSGAPLNLPGSAGSDDSTAIRVRTPTTMDYVVSILPPSAGRSSGSEPSARPD